MCVCVCVCLRERGSDKTASNDKHKYTDKLKSQDIREIPINNTKIIYKKSNKNCIQILEEMTIFF